MKKLLLATILTLTMLNANAFWLNDGTGEMQLQNINYKPNFTKVAANVEVKKAIPASPEMKQCFDNCAIDVDLLRQCRAHAKTQAAKVKCVNFSKRECLMRCKEKEFRENTISLLN